VEALDMVLKSWQVDGMRWLKQFIYVSLVANQNSYTIGPGSTDTVTTDAAGAVPYTQRPTRIYFPSRYTVATANEVPMCDPISRQEYSALPNKTTPGVPTQVFYEPGISTGTLYVWLAPSSALDKIKLTVDRIIEDVGADDSTFDVPPEWVRTIKWNLALEISPEYAMPPSERSNIREVALALKMKMDAFNVDESPTFIQPSSRGGR